MSAPTSPPSTVFQRSHRLLVLAVFVSLWALGGGLLPAAAQTDDDALRAELEQVEADQAKLSEALQAATARVDDLTARMAQVRDRAGELRGQLDALSRQEARAEAMVAGRLVELYKGERSNDFMALAGGTSLKDLTQRTHYLTAMMRGDQERFEAAQALIATTRARRSELAAVDSRLHALSAEADEAREELDAQFARASATQQELSTEIAQREEAARLAAEAEARRKAEAAAEARELAAAEAAEAAERRAAAASRSADREPQPPARQAAAPPAPAPAPPSSAPQPVPAPAGGGGKVCPQDNPRSFTDTWGAPRSGGRTHQGTDIFGARGGDVFAIVDGAVQWTSTGSTSGLFLSLRGDDGHTYWYMHLQDFVARAGQRVTAGELIAHNGDTGNAQGTTPHIHFEYHPGGGSAVNPYPMLKAACG